MRTLYFDIDGAILRHGTLAVKTAVGDGAFERAVRAARFDSIVCIGDVGIALHLVSSVDPAVDPLSVIIELTDGAFENEAWIREVASISPDPERRVRHVDFSGDWWYVDDLAEKYFERENETARFRRWRGRRILVPVPAGDGQDILEWLRQIPSR